MPHHILVTGSTGLVGSTLCDALARDGHTITRLKRGSGPNTWDPARFRIDSASLQGHDVAIHLAGENIAAHRWTDAHKKAIRDSRVHGTQLLAGALANLTHKPRLLICASAIGYYGCRGEEILTEQSDSGSSFLAEVCEQWERAADPARNVGIRVIHLRFGMILSDKGGAWPKMLPPFKLGIAGIIGDGKQYWSWITLDDVVGIIQFALHHESLAGPVNAVAPESTTCHTFTKTLGRVLHRPTIFPMPAAIARLAFGEMAEALLLCSARAVPAGLEQAGCTFKYPTLESALRHLLRR